MDKSSFITDSKDFAKFRTSKGFLDFELIVGAKAKMQCSFG